MQSRVKLLSSTALAAAAIVLAAPTASAQDIGALEKRVKALEKSGGGQNVSRSKKTMSLTISGHINRVIQLRDNGTDSGVIHGTANTSRSRVRWVGKGKINDDLTVGTYIEFGNQSSITTAQDLADNADVDGDAFDTRHIEMTITSKTLGKIYLGQSDTAAGGASERDLSGTGLLSLNGNNELLSGSEAFQNNNASVGITVGQVQNNFDAPRRDRLRYDTPRFAGFKLSLSHENNDAWDAGLDYGATIGGVKVAARVGYRDTETQNELTVVNGSASILLPFGLSLTIAAADQDSTADGTAADNAEWIYGKIGYKFNALELGQTRLFVDYSHYDEVRALDEEASTWAIGVVQIVEPLGAELYFGYQNHDLDQAAGADNDDIDIVTLGFRAKF